MRLLRETENRFVFHLSMHLISIEYLGCSSDRANGQFLYQKSKLRVKQTCSKSSKQEEHDVSKNKTKKDVFRLKKIKRT